MEGGQKLIFEGNRGKIYLVLYFVVVYNISFKMKD